MKKPKRFISIIKNLFPFIFFMGTLFSQTVTIHGKLLSETTYNPVPWANVVVAGTKIGTVTSGSGEFEITTKTLPVKLIFTHIGFSEKIVDVTTENLGNIYLKPSVLNGEEVLVLSSRAKAGETPVAFSTMDREQIERSYSNQDVPMVLSELPGVYAYSDAGNGVGYSYLKIRGFSQDRIGVLLNGIPLNDPEAHAVYWVDHGDILAAAGDVQLQRGVGNSLYGSSVFGGTVNMTTNYRSLYPGITVVTGYGNYLEQSNLDLPSQKLSLTYTGHLAGTTKNVTVYSRFSSLKSGGYRNGSGTGQQSFHGGIEINGKTRFTRVEAIVGQEETAFSWEGVIPYYGYDLKNRSDRRYNFYADPNYNGGRKNANKDVFTQSILSIQHSEKFSDGILSITAYKVKGDGYYEQFKGNRDVEEYNLTAYVPDSLNKVDLMRRKWLRNGYWGLVYQYSHPLSSGMITIGGDARFYAADHYGKVLGIDQGFEVPGNHRYYSNQSKKTSISMYIHTLFSLTERLNLMADLRYLGHRYGFDQQVIGAYQNGYNYKLKYDFLDPRVGLRYQATEALSLFANVSTAHREPADTDIYDQDDPDAVPAVADMDKKYAKPLTKEEFLIDYEAGLKFNHKTITGTVNLYRMDFYDELIPVWYRYYDADEVLQANAPRTIHQGVEIALKMKPFRTLTIDGSLSWADNYFVQYKGDSLGWSGYGGIADYSNKIIPAYPGFQGKAKVILTRKWGETWLQANYTGKQYIDFANTEEAAIDPFLVVNWSARIELPKVKTFQPVLTLWVNNIFDTLYETFGYNYYDWDDGPVRVDAYWPGATRNYYLTLTVRF